MESVEVVVELTDFEESDNGFCAVASRELEAEELTDFGGSGSVAARKGASWHYAVGPYAP